MPTVMGVNASPFVRKVRVFLAEKDVAYDLDPVIPVNVSDEFKKLSPLGKIPVYRDGDKLLPDSSAICGYLEKQKPQPALYPSDAYEYGRALWFEEYADTGLIGVIGPKIFFQKVINPAFFGKAPDEEVVTKAVNEELPVFFDYLESQLSGPYLAGGMFSIADIAVGSTLVNLRHAGYGVDANKWPKLAKYVAAVHGRPSFQSLIEEEAAQFSKAS